jgi:hypothetical protein
VAKWLSTAVVGDGSGSAPPEAAEYGPIQFLADPIRVTIIPAILLYTSIHVMMPQNEKNNHS